MRFVRWVKRNRCAGVRLLRVALVVQVLAAAVPRARALLLRLQRVGAEVGSVILVRQAVVIRADQVAVIPARRPVSMRV